MLDKAAGAGGDLEPMANPEALSVAYLDPKGNDEALRQDLFGNNRIPKASCDDCGNVDPDRPRLVLYMKAHIIPWGFSSTAMEAHAQLGAFKESGMA